MCPLCYDHTYILSRDSPKSLQHVLNCTVKSIPENAQNLLKCKEVETFVIRS